jgi:hypothetical protein
LYVANDLISFSYLKGIENGEACEAKKPGLMDKVKCLRGVGNRESIRLFISYAEPLPRNANELDYRKFKVASEGNELCKFNRCVVA